MIRKLFFVLVLFVASNSFAANDKAFAWQVSSENATLYLMGSIHFADKSFYPLRQDLEEAFARSDYLVVELDINKVKPGEYNSLIAEKGIYTNGKTIRDAISDETWQQLSQQLQQLNISYDAVKHYKPGVLVLTLTAMQVMQMGFDPELGIDAYFLSKAVSSKKIMELESLQQQINLFIDIPDGELLLKESLYSMSEAETMMAEMVQYWKQGDVEQMNKLLFEDTLNKYPAFKTVYESLFYQRNRRMVAKINAMLQRESRQKEYYFVVVGSGHLIGEQGIVNELRKSGYQVTRF